MTHSPDPRGRRGRILPQQTMDPRVTTVPGSEELRPINPNKCYAHDYPWKLDCPSCIRNERSDDDYVAMREYIEGGDF